MKDKFIRVPPHNDILRKAVQEYAFSIGKKWNGDKSGIFNPEWINECLVISADGFLTQCSYQFCKSLGAEELTLSEFFSLKEKEPDFFSENGARFITYSDGSNITINELADAIISKAMAKLKE